MKIHKQENNVIFFLSSLLFTRNSFKSFCISNLLIQGRIFDRQGSIHSGLETVQDPRKLWILSGFFKVALLSCLLLKGATIFQNYISASQDTQKAGSFNTDKTLCSPPGSVRSYWKKSVLWFYYCFISWSPPDIRGLGRFWVSCSINTVLQAELFNKYGLDLKSKKAKNKQKKNPCGQQSQ